MALTRRQFLKRSGAASAAALLGPSLFTNPFIRRAFAETIGDRYLVVLFLDGGNDGLNTVTPIDDGNGSLRTAYEVSRLTGGGGLRLLTSDLSGTVIGNDPNTNALLGLHPGLGGFKTLYDLGKLAVIQGCGYPSYSLSHDQSRLIWMAGDPFTPGGAPGWVGKHLAGNYLGNDIPAVSISDSVAGELRQSTTSVLAVRRLRDLGFPYDDVGGSAEVEAKRAAFAALYGAAGTESQATLHYIGESGTATLLASESYPALDDLYVTDRPAFDDAYDAIGRSTARDLREVAKMIYGVKNGVENVKARFFQLTNGGYDTHSDQGAGQVDGQHYNLHKEIGDSLKVFYDDCADMGVADKVCVMVWSEFSRRVPQNESGTDHGSQGPVFVIGGGVTGGVYGNHPNIDENALDGDGNTTYSQSGSFRSTDLRDIYGTILKHWLNVPEPTILSSILPLDGGDPNDYWTTQNFDLGFL